MGECSGRTCALQPNEECENVRADEAVLTMSVQKCSGSFWTIRKFGCVVARKVATHRSENEGS